MQTNRLRQLVVVLVALLVLGSNPASGNDSGRGRAESQRSVDIPVLLWAPYVRSDGTTGYWDPRVVAEFRATKVNVFHQAADRSDRPVYQGALHPPRLLEEMLANCRPEIQECHQRGIKVIGFANTTFFHPEMLQRENISSDGLSAVDRGGQPVINRRWEKRGAYLACVNSPRWLELQTGAIQAMIAAGFDAVQLDLHPYAVAPGYNCHCEHCQAGWQQASRSAFGTAKPFPSESTADAFDKPPDFRDIVSRVYREWRHERLAQFLLKLADGARQVNPHALVTLNHIADDSNYAYLASRGAMPIPSGELWHLNLGDDSSLYLYRLTEALSGERLIGLVNYPDQLKPDYRARVAAAEAYAGGGAFYFSPVSPLCKPYAHFVAEQESWYTGFESDAAVAVLHSRRDEEFASDVTGGKTDAVKEPKKMRRLAATLARRGIPYDVISLEAGDLTEELPRYRVVAAEDLRLLSEEESSALKEYVRQGGKLLASGKFGQLRREENGEFVTRAPGLLESWLGRRPSEPEVTSLESGQIAAMSRASDGIFESELRETPEFQQAAKFLDLSQQLRVVAATPITTAVRSRGNRRALHLIRLGPAEGLTDLSIHVDYELPKDREPASVLAISPDAQQPSVEAHWQVKDGRLKLDLPRVQSYVLVGIELKN
jgi:hypothetical protein